jgi:vacuolar-type H+-ATPase subunit I/STV1
MSDDVCPICKSEKRRKIVDRGPPYYGKFPKELYEWECMQCGRLYNTIPDEYLPETIKPQFDITGFDREYYSEFTKKQLIDEIKRLRQDISDMDLRTDEKDARFVDKIEELYKEIKELKDRLEDIRLEGMEEYD